KIKISQIKSKSKKQEICLPRYLAMYLIKEMKKISLQKIAKEFDKKDHTTVLSGLKIITKKINEDRNFFSFINKLKEKIKKFN
ncbi:MAG: chromosomal replication initiator protein DnaA, partial [Mycoplasma sp.]|nr:chromosomal replication initiator protein DnaA [Mycoplasma sp.]